MAESKAPDPGTADPQKTPTGQHQARQNQRRHLRFRLENASATVYIKGFMTSIGLGWANKARAAVNLSEGGVLVLTTEPLAVGTKVQVRIEIEKHGDFIESAGEVRWCFQSARSESEFYAGIMFTNLAPLEVKKIAKMREWFTSPEYKTRTITRRRLSKEAESDPKP